MISNGAASAASSDWIAWPTVDVEHLDFLRQDRLCWSRLALLQPQRET